MVERIADGPRDIRSVIGRAKNHPQFGPWIAFKVADMLDAVVGVTVLQNDLSLFLYQTPRDFICENLPDASPEQAMRWLADQLGDCRIPHKPESPPDWFSLETVWCKHLSHRRGHYNVGHDTAEIKRGLMPWRKVSQTANEFLRCMPQPNPIAVVRKPERDRVGATMT